MPEKFKPEFEGEVIQCLTNPPFKIVLIGITSLCTSDPDGVRSVFHPSARITGYLPDGLHEMTVDDFAGFVQSQQPSPAESGAQSMLEILSIEVWPHRGIAMPHEAISGWSDLVDTFGMLQVDGQWLIYNKLFHVEG